MLCHGHRSSNTTPLFSRARSKSWETPRSVGMPGPHCWASCWHQEPGCWVLYCRPLGNVARAQDRPLEERAVLGVSHDNNLKGAFKSTTFSWPGPMMALWHSSFLSLVKHILRFLDRKGGPAKASMPKQGKNRGRRHWGGNISTVAHKLNFTTSSFASRTIRSLRCLPSACTRQAVLGWNEDVKKMDDNYSH